MFYVWFQNTSYVSQNWFPTPFAWNHPRQRWLHRTSMLSSVVRINCSTKIIVRPGQSPSSWTACTSAPGRKTCSSRLNLFSYKWHKWNQRRNSLAFHLSPESHHASIKTWWLPVSYPHRPLQMQILLGHTKQESCVTRALRRVWSISLQPNLLQKDVDMYTVFCMNLLLYNDANWMLPKTMDQSQQAELADKSSSSDKACISLPMTWNDGRWVEL